MSMKDELNGFEIEHPSHYLDVALIETIRSVIPEAEQAGSLHQRQLAVIYEQRWFNLFVPKTYNGLQLSLPEGLRLEESLAWIDGSVGWTVTLCGGANWFIGFLQPELSMMIFSNGSVCLAGSGRPSGKASIVDGGYEITGRWKYATGSAHATAFTANCVIENNGIVQYDVNGKPIIRSFVFLRDEVTLYDDWDNIGMLATSSNSFEVQRVRVPENRTFIIAAEAAKLDLPIYQYPFLQFAEATLAVNISGMSMRFLELCEKLFIERDKYYKTEGSHTALTCLETAIKKLAMARKSFYYAIQNSWNECERYRRVNADLLQQVSIKSRELATIARRLTDELYPYCGLTAARKSSDINRVWRNLHTASQHSVLV